MKDWFYKLESRERKVLIGGGISLVLIMFYFLIMEPMLSEKARMQEKNIQQTELLAWMKQAADQLKQLRAEASSNGSQSSKSSGSLLGMIDSSSKRANLSSAVKRVQPDGKTKAKVWLENAKFNDVMLWLEKLKRSEGITIISSVTEKQNEPGIVNVRLVLQGTNG